MAQNQRLKFFEILLLAAFVSENNISIQSFFHKSYTARYRIVDFSGLVKSLTFSKVQILYIFRACMILYLDRKGWNSFNKQYWCDLEVLCSYC